MFKFENQKHLRRAFFEEFKIHSFNYILLLFESVIRILTTVNKDEDDFEEFKEDLKEKKPGASPAPTKKKDDKD